ncbi:hypothetical protein D7S86_19075 [Pararobbsia silviterrae]|uniref:Uncharacterized protein n=1 Tax=Pararobbsia silviterrae TaxID=1792498 RepID=A0A494XKH2_9BURK|nr:hypothetical protein D7S86_19075 [Pararobbsia silviterrae]
MNTYAHHAAQAIKSLFKHAFGRCAGALRALRPQRRRVIEIEYRRRPEAGTRRSAVIHIDARGRRQRS